MATQIEPLISQLLDHCSVRCINITVQLILLLAHSALLFLLTRALPHIPTDGATKILSLTHMPRLGIELASAMLHLLKGP